MKRAFTLIELLVVIAIIAILAAILFPVFAQAKEAAKKSAAISNMKQMGTSTQIYLADSDDVFPLDGIGTAAGLINTGAPAAYPAGWHPAFDASPYATNFSISHWANSTQPYMKNLDLNQVQAAPQFLAWNPATLYTDPARRQNAGRFSTTFNGYLHGYSATAVAAPSGLTLFWYGFGKQDVTGGGFSQPLLQCFNVPSCIYTPGGVPSAGAGTNQTFMWGPRRTFGVFTGGGNFTRCDTSTKFYRLGLDRTGTVPGGDWRIDPFARYTTTGDLASVWTRTVNGVAYILHFMPDVDR
jgi:prepilin-type N-terminal cleavage/methylation domain-containing protein